MDAELLPGIIAAIPPGAWMSYGDVAGGGRRRHVTPARSTGASCARRCRARTAS